MPPPPFLGLKAPVSAWKARHGTIDVGGLGLVGDTCGAVARGHCWRQLASLLDSPASLRSQSFTWVSALCGNPVSQSSLDSEPKQKVSEQEIPVS